MPTVINPWKSGGGIGDTLGDTLSGLGEAFFGPKAAQTAFTREKFIEAQRQNAATMALPDAIIGGNQDDILRQSIYAGNKPGDTYGHQQGRGMATVDLNTPQGQDTATRLMLAVPGTSVASTPWGMGAQLQKTREIEDNKTQRLIEAAQLKDNSAFVTVFNPDRTGTMTMTVGQVAAANKLQPGSVEVVPSQDIRRSSQVTQMWPTLDQREQKHSVGALPPAEKGQMYRWVDANGNTVQSGLSQDGGLTDAHTKQSTQPPDPSIQFQLLGPENPAAATTGTTGLAKEVRESRINTRIATSQIDRVIAGLDQPNAAGSIGLVGKGASIINGLVSQINSVTGAAREGGYNQVAGIFQDGTTKFLNQNPGILAMAQQRGISRDVLHSQISGLAYAIARANNQQGTLGVRDVEDGLRQIGGNLFDPASMKAVLSSVKTGLIEGQRIREEVYGETSTPQTRRTLNINPPPPAGAGPPIAVPNPPTPGAVAAPAAVAPPPLPPGFIPENR